MNREEYQKYCTILRQELRTALGCTEPIAIAFAAAKAREVLGSVPTALRLQLSGNIIKNAKAVTVPNSGGLVGIEVAAILGALGGDSSLELEVLSPVGDALREQVPELLKKKFCQVQLLESPEKLAIEATAIGDGHEATVSIRHTHTNIVAITLDGKSCRKNSSTCEMPAASCTVANHDHIQAAEMVDKTYLTFAGVFEFIEALDVADLSDLLEHQIACNSAIAAVGLQGGYGAEVGLTLKETRDWNDVRVRAAATAAAGSDARMGGLAMPVVINSGSGNQGMTVTLPVLEYAKELKVEHDVLLKALALANLMALLQKKLIGDLSAFCGVTSAAVGAACGICWLKGADKATMEQVIVNALATLSGMVCDGAKPSCAAKIATAVQNACMAMDLADRKRGFHNGEGLVKASAASTIEAIGKMARDGMAETDTTILQLMLE